MAKMKVMAGAVLALTLAFAVIPNAFAATIKGDFGTLGVGDNRLFGTTTSGSFTDAWTFSLDSAAIAGTGSFPIFGLAPTGATVSLASGSDDGAGSFVVDTVFGTGPFGSYITDTLPGAGTYAVILEGTGASTYLATLNLTAVPIPAAAWLFGSSLLGVVWVGRRRRSLQAA